MFPPAQAAIDRASVWESNAEPISEGPVRQERQMGDVQGIMGHPGVGLFSMLIIGGLAGWIAGMVVESRHGILTNILVGIAGSFVGSTLAELLQIPTYGFWRLLIAATVGAIVILFIWRRVRP
jgi:uncharacterized membrane protein YeaQ/YmgE (transglycosylase-associated protein family)